MHKVVRIAYIALLALLLFAPLAAHPQGCSLCKDATAGSAPKARQGLRRAILVLGIPAAAIFLTVLALATRIPPSSGEDYNLSSPLTVESKESH
jgi:hypothetical protein